VTVLLSGRRHYATIRKTVLVFYERRTTKQSTARRCFTLSRSGFLVYSQKAPLHIETLGDYTLLR